MSESYRKPLQVSDWTRASLALAVKVLVGSHDLRTALLTSRSGEAVILERISENI
ncbi:hypothetical protein [Amycolatopsis sp. cg13]|uniref:hypothetical protein n=1 Tax=Amycolatopsis sp. cg13 TaxID=3238807 RepID=UPI003523FEE9